jgi:hypothetical protein
VAQSGRGGLGIGDPPVVGHHREVEERRLVAGYYRILDLVVEALAGLLGEGDDDFV